jgi:tetratricopeptide (TPR) repeat protein
MEDAAALNVSGIALTEANLPNEAIPFFFRALTLEPDNPLLWTNLGIAQQHTGDYEAALDSFHQAAALRDSLADPWVSMGLIYYELGHFNRAENCYRAALLRDNGDPRIWNNLGVLYFTDGAYEEARFCFEAAVSILPMYYDALYNLVDTCRELRDYRAAGDFGGVLSGLDDRRSFRT